MPSRLAKIDRLQQVVRVLVRHGLLGLADQLGLGDRRLTARHARGEMPAARLGRRLALALDDLGPTFVKLGQFLSAREDLLPAATVRELARLQDGAATLPARVIRRQVAAALGRPLADAFAWFDDQPLAAGSIAQVHRARTRDGAEVVVKVRRPGIETRIADDLALLEVIARRAAARSAEIARLDPLALLAELETSLRLELDFDREAACLRRMRGAVGTSARVPRVHDELSAGPVLTMEWIDGVKLTSLPPEADPARVARAVVGCFATQYLTAGMFHADPHGGNLLYTRDGRLALIDLGATGDLDPGMRRTLLHIAAAAGRRDGARLAEVGLELVHAPADLDRHAFCDDLGRLLDDALSRPIGELRVDELSRGVFAAARRHRLRLRWEYFLLFRSAGLVDGVLRGLDPTLDPVAATRAHIVRHALTRRWAGSALWLGWQTARLRLASPRARLVLCAGAVTACALTVSQCT
jgi:ubiquinone biosynthesis protein